jgi:Matrixin/Repeat of unknown function (DUF5648)
MRGPPRSNFPLTAGLAVALGLAFAAPVALADPALPWPGFEGSAAERLVNPLREDEAKHTYLFGSPSSWAGQIVWSYNSAGQPATMSPDTVTATIAASAQQWMNVCKVQIVRGGDTDMAPQNMDGTLDSPGVNIIGWGDLTQGVHGSSNVAGVTWGYGGPDNTLTGFDTTYSQAFVTNTTQLSRVSLHEWGHALGLAHSNIPGAVMSGPTNSNNAGVPDTPYNAVTSLTDDDRQGCLCLYGPSDSNASQGYLCGLPTVAAMGTVETGAQSTPVPVTLTNVSKTASLTVTSVTMSSSEMSKTAGCSDGTVLGPGAACSFNLVFAPKGSIGARATSYVNITTANGQGAYAFPVTATASSPNTSGGSPPVPIPLLRPTIVAFGAVTLASTSNPATVTLGNAGNGEVDVQSINQQNGSGDFGVVGTCGPGVALHGGDDCTLSITFTPRTLGPQTASFVIGTSSGPQQLTLTGTGVSGPSTTSEVVEFYNAALDHYFMTADLNEIEVLDAGTISGWQRTGYSFAAFITPATETSPVCRYYIPPAQGNSHFFSVLPSECNVIPTEFPTFILEGLAVMYMYIPDISTGACPQGSIPVYRLWNNRPDSNHRYTIDATVRTEMIARGYISEGYGTTGVAMCAPQ